ncbi:MAG TPA: hypothetical protein VJS92_07645 [Candidatus Polarisedimenticolaceae bacterium]|nr:hypothetical protein [Candidatus Polarisedimenticolaceae bacterium]
MLSPSTAEVQWEAEDIERLRFIARQRGTTVAELILAAVRNQVLVPFRERAALVEEILGMRLPVNDWRRAEREIEVALENVS